MQEQVFLDKAVFRRGKQVKVCVQHVFDRNNVRALNIDMASGEQSNWADKDTFQMTIDECSLLAAYFLKLVDSINLSFHGENNNKSLMIAKSDNSNKGSTQHYIGMYQGGKIGHYIHLSHHEGFRVFNLALDQLSNHYQQSRTDVISLLKAYYAQ